MTVLPPEDRSTGQWTL